MGGRKLPDDDWLIVSTTAEFGQGVAAEVFGVSLQTLKNYLSNDLYPRLGARRIAHAVLILTKEKEVS